MLPIYKTLIVDDIDYYLMDLKRLKVWGDISGFSITGIANNGKQALDLLQENSYDLVITDIRMPIIDGLQLLHEIKKKNLCTCVILFSEHSDFHYAHQGIIFGAFDYLLKPAEKNELLTLLKRAKQYIRALHENDCSSVFSMENSEEEWLYPISQENQLLHYFKAKNTALISLFESTVDDLYSVMKDHVLKADLMVKKLYHNIITMVYKEYPWLHYFIHIHFFEEVDYIHDGDGDSFRSFYSRKIGYLINFIRKYEPPIADNTIKEIIDYVLAHSESDLKLKVIALKFFINNTYLSHAFFLKTGIHFNDYTTTVKMARAEYLFKNTDLKIYEIGSQLGYKDINYFSKQFKNTYGMNPTEYRSSEFSDYQI